ncbi:hypothetical protein SmJEL517_g01050 [Synchytrium microbalum]|uniref:Uncharacterized protein n=1 Tax=Synchytrium microbalum TaxID=1806994 RepID=A0A507CHI9_9FUNG|nr:uncharacterized protein SmJEL517_g01050 [Synchytrium microbalum]TPX37155.1 hypothetical protein SmJEL517_g01050 [Synchytrium microbalum]
MSQQSLHLSTSPVSPLRHPRGFPASVRHTSATTTKPRSSMSQPTTPSRPKSAQQQSSLSSPPRTNGLEDECVRNLQQQVYLLELETRYLRGGRPGGAPSNESEPQDNVQTLKSKFTELQTVHKQEVKKLQDVIEELRRRGPDEFGDVHELRLELQTLKDNQVIEKDKLSGEIIQLRRQLDSADADKMRLEASLKRVSDDFHVQRTRGLELTDTANHLREQVNEQLALNTKHVKKIEELTRQNRELEMKIEESEGGLLSVEYESLKQRLAEVHQDNLSLQQDIKQMQVVRAQEEHMRNRVQEDCAELVKENVMLRKELDNEQRKLKKELENRDQKIKRRQDNIREADQAREELERLRDEKATNIIRAEAQERRLQEISKEAREKDCALSKALEARALHEERLLEAERRLQKTETELIQLAQDKRALFDDLALAKNQVDVQSHKQQKAQHEKRELQRELDMYRREHSARLKLAETVQGLQGAEEQYLSLVREVSRISPSSTI